MIGEWCWGGGCIVTGVVDTVERRFGDGCAVGDGMLTDKFSPDPAVGDASECLRFLDGPAASKGGELASFERFRVADGGGAVAAALLQRDLLDQGGGGT